MVKGMMKGKILYLFLVGIIFIFIYNPPIYFLPMNAGIIVGMGFFAYYIIKFALSFLLERKISLDLPILSIMLTVVIIVFYSLMVGIISGSYDLQVFKSYLSFLLFYIPGAFGIVHIARRHYEPIDIIKMFIVATVIQSIIILMMLVVPSVKDFFFSLLKDGDARLEKNLLSGGFRFLGFAFNSTWDLAIVQSMGIMYICLMIKLDKHEISLKNSLFFLLLVTSVFLSARTGLIGIILGLLILVFPSSMREVPMLKVVKFFSKLIAITIPLFFLIIIILPSEVIDIVENSVVPWAFELFQNQNAGTMETNSSNELKEMYFIPKFSTVLFGDGYYVSPYDVTRYYMDTDAGYMRHMLYYGVLGCLIMVTLYLLIFRQIYKSSNVLNKSNSVKFFSILLAFYFFLSHIKGDLFLGADMPIKSLFFLLALLTVNKNVNERFIEKSSLI